MTSPAIHRSTAEYMKCMRSGVPGLAPPQYPHRCYKPLHCNTPETFTTCYNHIHKLPPSDWSPSFSAGYQDYVKCTKNIEAHFKRCEPVLTKSCNEQSVRIFKTIRMRMEYFKQMLMKDPSLKTIYLVRDPRGIINSRISRKLMSRLAGKDVQRESDALCERMSEDILEYEEIKKRWPDNILLVRYEDIVSSTVTKVATMYHFTRAIQIPQHVMTALKQQMYATQENSWIGTSRRNATETAYKWRTDLSIDNLNVINHKCADVLEKLNYPV